MNRMLLSQKIADSMVRVSIPLTEGGSYTVQIGNLPSSVLLAYDNAFEAKAMKDLFIKAIESGIQQALITIEMQKLHDELNTIKNSQQI